jgi:zinc protease
MRRPAFLAALVVGLTGSVPGVAEPAAAANARPSAISEVPFEKYTLPNGLEVILHRDPSLPLTAVNIWYHVGPANEPQHRSGFAHLFEHLMFEGSKHVGRRFDTLLESAGATNVNGTTSWDRTNYYETVPSQYLELVLWIESDRMGFMLDQLDAARLEVQRGVVKNERRQSYENAPYGPSGLTLLDTLYPTGHPYHGAIIGSMADLDAATQDDVKSFFQAYYAPSNATLAIAGDFEPTRVKQLVERYFGSLAKRDKPKRRALRTGPVPGVKRVHVSEPVELAKVSMGFIVPPAYSKDDAALEVTAAVLAGGKATRLHRSLVIEQKIASEVDAELEANQLASTFSVSAIAASGKTPAALEAGIDAELARLAASGPTMAELDRAKRRLLVDLASSLQLLNGRDGESGRAGLLQRFNHYYGDPGHLDDEVRALTSVTAADVQRVVKQHLDLGHRVIVSTEPKGGAKP